MATNVPVSRVEIEGKNVIKDFYSAVDWNPVQQSEDRFSFNSTSSPGTSGWIEIKSNAIDIVNLIMVDAPIPSTAGAYTTTLRLQVNDGVLPQYNIDMNIEGLNILRFGDVFGSYIKSVQVKTSSTTDVTIEARVYSL